jgi:hypothetical protein
MPVEVPGRGGPRREALEQLGQEDYGPLEQEQEEEELVRWPEDV